MAGEFESLEWKSSGSTVTRTVEWAFDTLPPSCRGFLRKASPNSLRAMLRIISWDRQPRICVVQDGHFLWFDEESATAKGQAKGCINFFMHKASIRRDERNPNAFIIAPAEPQGWHDPSSFTGNAYRSFFFDASDSEVSCADWVSTIEENINFANLAAEQMGSEFLALRSSLWNALRSLKLAKILQIEPTRHSCERMSSAHPRLFRQVKVFKPSWTDLET